MTASQIESTYKTANSFLLTGKLKQAFDQTKLLVQELQWGDLNDQYNDLLQNYRFMLQYFISGTEDPERKVIYNKITSKLISLNSRMLEELMMRNATTFEFTQKRYFPHKLHFNATNDLYDSLTYYHQQKLLLQVSEDNTNKETKRLRGNFEKLLPDLFFIFWLNTKLEVTEKKLFHNILHHDYPGFAEKNLIISALTLNLWRMFDEDKVILLLDACQHHDMHVKQRALVGLCFILTRYNKFLPYFPLIRNRLMVLADDSKTVENLKNIIILIIGTADTDRITKKMQEEILPEVMKISPILKDKMEAENLLKSEEWDEENPEWNEILEQSGVADKLQELSELQLEGADVYMSTFSALKNFPFFSETAHWFLPFDTEFSAVEELFENKDKSIISAFLGNSAICNSDKYSFCLSVLQMPFSQREMMSKSFSSEAEQLEEITKDESILKPDLAARNSAKQYIQDLFRFFRVHPQHADFKDMFDFSLHMHQTIFFDLLAANSDIKIHTAEYYFSKKHYPQALEIFLELTKESKPSSSLYQKIGFSFQKNSQIKEALEAYIKADMIMPDDLWTVKKIALCYRLSGNYEKALEHYKHLDFLQPGKYRTKMQIANCLIANNKHKEALQIYAELEMTETDNDDLWRAISWCAFISGNIHQAAYYSEKIISFTPNATDYLNAGHIAFCQKQRTIAIDFYRKSLYEQKNNLELIINQIQNDKPHLKSNGIDSDEISLMMDELSFLSE